MAAEVSKASRLTLFLQANRSDLRAEVSKASRLTLFLQANRPDLPAEVSKASYLYSEVFDLKPTSGLYLKKLGCRICQPHSGHYPAPIAL